MARKLSTILEPISIFLATARLRLRMPIGPNYQLPSVLENSRIRGEARLILCFYQFLDSNGVRDPDRQLVLWEQLIGNGRNLLDVCQRLNVFKFFSGPLDSKPEKAAFIAWCILVDNLYLAKQGAYSQATEQLMRFFFLGLYPSKPQPVKESMEKIRNQLLREIKKRWGNDTELKESFRTDQQPNLFSLRIKAPGQTWLTLLTCQGESIKPLRQLTYKQLLSDIQSGKISHENCSWQRLLPVKGKSWLLMYVKL